MHPHNKWCARTKHHVKSMARAWSLAGGLTVVDTDVFYRYNWVCVRGGLADNGHVSEA